MIYVQRLIFNHVFLATDLLILLDLIFKICDYGGQTPRPIHELLYLFSHYKP